MEGLTPLYRHVAGIDVHRMLHVVTVIIEHADGTIEHTSREFGGFRRDCRALAAWLVELKIELVVMESTGIYWKGLYSHLERAGINAWVVNAHFVKHVPGRKTDMNDSQWLLCWPASALYVAVSFHLRTCASCAYYHATGANLERCVPVRLTAFTRFSMMAASSLAV